MEKWFVMRKGAPFQEIAEKFNIHPILARLIRNRDVIGEENIERYLHGTIADLHDGMLMKDMDKAIDILLEKIREEKKIRVIGIINYRIYLFSDINSITLHQMKHNCQTRKRWAQSESTFHTL